MQLRCLPILYQYFILIVQWALLVSELMKINNALEFKCSASSSWAFNELPEAPFSVMTHHPFIYLISLFKQAEIYFVRSKLIIFASHRFCP